MNRWLAIGLTSLIVGVGGCVDYGIMNLTRVTTVSLTESMKSAQTAVPDGRIVEAGLERHGEEGRLVYEVALINAKQDLRHVYVDANSGEVIRIQ